MYTHVQHLPKMVVVVCGKMDLVVFEKYLGTHLMAVSSIGELEPPNSGFQSLPVTSNHYWEALIVGTPGGQTVSTCHESQTEMSQHKTQHKTQSVLDKNNTRLLHSWMSKAHVVVNKS
jgi:hypothetical protein